MNATGKKINSYILREAKKILGYPMAKMEWDGTYANHDATSTVTVYAPDGPKTIEIPNINIRCGD